MADVRRMRTPVEYGSPRVIRLASLLLCVVLSCASASAQTVELVGDDRVTVHADGVILVNLLRELESVIPIEQILLDPAVDGKSVSIALEGATFQEAIEEIFAAAEVNYALSGKDKGPFRIFAGSGHPPRPVPLSERPTGVSTSGGTGVSAPPQAPDPPPRPAVDPPPRPVNDPQIPVGPPRPASGEAYLGGPPDRERLAMTLAILLAGFLSGTWLVELAHRARSRDSEHANEPV